MEEESTIKNMAQGLLNASPLTLSLLVMVLLLALLLFLAYKIMPHLVTKKEEERREWDKKTSGEFAKYSRVEEMAVRLHKLTGSLSVMNLLAEKIKSLEEDMEKQQADSGELRSQIADLMGTTRELHVKIDGLGDRIDRDAEAMSSRFAGLEEGMRNIARTLLSFVPGNGRRKEDDR